MPKHFLKSCAVILLSLLLVNPCWAGIDFDGVDDGVNCGNVAVAGLLSNKTYSAWIRPDAAAVVRPIFVCQVDATSGNEAFSMQGTDIIQFLHKGSTNLLITTNTTITEGVWSHLLLTWTGSTVGTTVHIYLNGTEVSYSGQTSGVTLSSNNTFNQLIGINVANTQWFNGQITEAAVWNKVLSAAEIALLASSRIKGMPLQIQPANLKGYWPLDDEEAGTSGDGDTFLDLSGNGNNGTGSDGANNTGLTSTAETVLSYQPKIGNWQ